MGVRTEGSQVVLKGDGGNVLAFPQDFVGVWESRRKGTLPKWERRSYRKVDCAGMYVRIIRNRGLLSWKSGCWVG